MSMLESLVRDCWSVSVQAFLLAGRAGSLGVEPAMAFA